MSIPTEATVPPRSQGESTLLAPGIFSTPGVRGGDPCVSCTRIAVWVLEAYRRFGLDDDALLDSYPTLRRDDLANAWAYVADHSDEIDRRIREEDEDDEGGD